MEWQITMTRKNIISLFAAGLVMLAGCGSNTDDTQPSQETKAAVSVSEVLGAVDEENLDGTILKGDSLFDDNAKKFYGVDADKITEGGMLYNTEGSQADEVDIIRFADDVDGKAVLEKRLSERRATFDSYKPEDMPKFDKAQVFEEGGYDVLIISDNAESISKLIKDKIG